MTGENNGSRRASYLIAAAVIFLLVLVGAAYFAITAVRGDEADSGPDSSAPPSNPLTTIAAGPTR